MQKRQGDLLFESVDRIPDQHKVLKTSVIEYGEATGHAHELTVIGSAELISVSPKTERVEYINVNDSATIKHNTHLPVVLPKGKYQVIRQSSLPLEQRGERIERVVRYVSEYD